MQPPGSSEAIEARPASTVLVARDAGSGGIEILLTQRHRGMRFMGGAFVFPGGAVEPSDLGSTLAQQITVPAPLWPGAKDAEVERGHVIAAVRETFEEVGLLLGAPPLEAARLSSLRVKILAGDDFGERLAAEQIALDLSRLVPLIRWITPRSEPIRFDTRFFVAPLPAGQLAEHDARESIALVWRSPSDALADAKRGSLALSPPTRRTLQEIEHVESVDALLRHANASNAPTVEPLFKDIEGVRFILYPGDPEHPERERAMSGPTRHRL
jgi:8-oxo-dGTP pyrophosphatase MutT (NUDIX family)